MLYVPDFGAFFNLWCQMLGDILSSPVTLGAIVKAVGVVIVTTSCCTAVLSPTI